jgi:hypothetical protein
MKFFVLIFACAVSLTAGKFNCGTFNASSDMVSLKIPRPPDAYPQIKSIKVAIVESDKSFTGQTRLKAQIEQALAHDFNVDAQKADARLLVTVVAYDAPTVSSHTQTEQRAVTSGNTTTMQNVPVTYWIGSGRISLRVQMVDADDVPMDTFDPEEIYRVTREAIVRATGPGGAAPRGTTGLLRIPGLPGTKTSAKPEEAAAVTGQEMTPAEINAAMLDTVAIKIRRRYVRSEDSVEFKLACDEDLRAGNRMAMGSTPDWEKATNLWTNATVGKNEGDRAYNLAVAQEALAYKAYNATLNPADAVPFFDKALALYAKAEQLDPTEKYINASAERLKTARTNIARAIDQRKLWESERDKARDVFIAKREGAKAIGIKRDDSPKEAGYRALVRASLSADPKKDLNPLRDTGDKMGLNEFEIQRVITQETERSNGMTQYDVMFTQMAADGIISKDERLGLDAFYPTLNMSPADVKLVEAKHKFTEEGVAPVKAAAAPPAAAPAPGTSAAPTARTTPAKTTTPAKPKVTPAAGTPAATTPAAATPPKPQE